MIARLSNAGRFGVSLTRAFALALLGMITLLASPVLADDDDEWTKTRLLEKKTWTKAELKEASETDPPGALIDKIEDGRVHLNTAVMVNRGCEQTWNAVNLENDEKMSVLFGKTIVTTERTKVDDGYDTVGHEEALGMKPDDMAMEWRLSEGDPTHRVVMMKSKDPDVWAGGHYEFIDVGSPEHCIFAMKMGFELLRGSPTG